MYECTSCTARDKRRWWWRRRRRRRRRRLADSRATKSAAPQLQGSFVFTLLLLFVLCVCVCVCASFALLSLPWVALAVAAVVGVAGAMGVQVAANKSPSTMFAQQSRICGNRVGTSVHSLCRGVEKLGVAPLRHRTRLAKLSTSSAGRRVAVVAAQAVSSDEATAPVEQSKRSSNAAWVENRAFFPPTFGGLEIESRNQMCRCICTLWVGEGA